MKENFKEATIEALFTVIEAFENNSIGSSNETLLKILSERIETKTTGMNKIEVNQKRKDN